MPEQVSERKGIVGRGNNRTQQTQSLVAVRRPSVLRISVEGLHRIPTKREQFIKKKKKKIIPKLKL